jgi:hypothetical protein
MSGPEEFPRGVNQLSTQIRRGEEKKAGDKERFPLPFGFLKFTIVKIDYQLTPFRFRASTSTSTLRFVLRFLHSIVVDPLDDLVLSTGSSHVRILR